jgi:hypothetical protein
MRSNDLYRQEGLARHCGKVDLLKDDILQMQRQLAQAQQIIQQA